MLARQGKDDSTVDSAQAQPKKGRLFAALSTSHQGSYVIRLQNDPQAAGIVMQC